MQLGTVTGFLEKFIIWEYNKNCIFALSGDSHKMKNNFILWVIISLVIMLVLPWLAVSFVKGDAGMAVCFILFFAVNPIYSVILGVFAGKNIKRLWGMPVISAVLFLLGSWIFFSMGERAFILYAGVYLILGIAAMTISMIIHRKAQR